MPISKLITKVSRIFDGVIKSFAVVAGIIIIFMVASVLYEIVLRYFLGRTAVWVFEVTEYCLLFLAFLVTAWLLKEEGHVKMDLVLNRLNPKNRDKIITVTSIIGSMVCLTISWGSAGYVWHAFQMGYTMTTPLLPPQALILFIIPVCSFLLFIQFLRRAYGHLRSWRAT